MLYSKMGGSEAALLGASTFEEKYLVLDVAPPHREPPPPPHLETEVELQNY